MVRARLKGPCEQGMKPSFSKSPPRFLRQGDGPILIFARCLVTAFSLNSTRQKVKDLCRLRSPGWGKGGLGLHAYSLIPLPGKTPLNFMDSGESFLTDTITS